MSPIDLTKSAARPQRHPWIDRAVTLVMLMATVGTVGFVVQKQLSRRQYRTIDPPLPTEPIEIVHSVTKGDPNAPLVLIEYSDFHCAACLQFARGTSPFIDDQYVDKGKVLRVYRHYPAKTADKLSLRTAEMASCAARQGRFWAMHDALFERDVDPKLDAFEVGTTKLRALAERVGIQIEAMDACVKEVGRDDVLIDIGTGRLLEVTGTPTIFIGWRTAQGDVQLARRIAGAIPPTELAGILDALLRGGAKTN